MRFDEGLLEIDDYAVDGTPFTKLNKHPQLRFEKEGLQKLNNIAMLAFRKNVNLHYKIFELIFTAKFANLGGRKLPRLLVLCLIAKH